VPSAPPPDWYTRLVRALDQDDPERARAAARALLGEIHDEEGRVRERLDMLSAASFEGILVHVDGVVIDVNQRFCELLGRERDEVLEPSSLSRAVAPEDLPRVLERMARHHEGGYVITCMRKDGSRFRAELHSQAGPHRRPPRALRGRPRRHRARAHRRAPARERAPVPRPGSRGLRLHGLEPRRPGGRRRRRSRPGPGRRRRADDRPTGGELRGPVGAAPGRAADPGRVPRIQFQGFLAKPYGASDLAAAIEAALAHR